MVGTADAHVFQIPSHLHAQQRPVNFHSQQHHQLLFPGGQPSCCWNPLCLCVAGAASAWEFLTLLGAALIQWLMRGRGVGSGALESEKGLRDLVLSLPSVMCVCWRGRRVGLVVELSSKGLDCLAGSVLGSPWAEP